MHLRHHLDIFSKFWIFLEKTWMILFGMMPADANMDEEVRTPMTLS
jgi:hypothetical protein